MLSRAADRGLVRLTRLRKDIERLRRRVEDGESDETALRKDLRSLKRGLEGVQAAVVELDETAAPGAETEEDREYRGLVDQRIEHLVAVDQPLVLISQIQRSGGTLLSQLFDGHPQLHAHPYELYIGHPEKSSWPMLDLDAGLEDWYRVLHEAPAARAFEDSYRKDAGRGDADEVESFPYALPPLVQAALFETCAKRRRIRSQRGVLDCYMTSYFNAWLDNRNLFGDKRWVTGFVPRVHMHEGGSLERFFSDYPDGRLISIVRDPRGWWLSASAQRDFSKTKRVEREYATVEGAIQLWMASSRATMAARDRYGELVKVITFESLVADTESTMRSLASYLDIEFEPRLLTPTFNGLPIKADSSFAVPGHGVIKDPLDRYKEALPSDELRYIEAEALDLYTGLSG